MNCPSPHDSMRRRHRMAVRILVVSLIGGLFPSVSVSQQRTPQEKKEPSAKMLIETGELQKSLNRDGLRILDTRSQSAYAEGHIPNAVWVDVPALQNLAKSKGGFHKKDEWGRIIGGLGIDKDTAIVVYGDKLSNTARVWWMLKYAGLKDVKILDGGWALWLKEKHAVSKQLHKPKQTEYTPVFQADRLEEIETLKKSVDKENVKVLDTRSEGEFTGKTVRGKRGGRIPGATHIEWKELVADDGRFKSREQLRALFRERGLDPKQKMVCY